MSPETIQSIKRNGEVIRLMAQAQDPEGIDPLEAKLGELAKQLMKSHDMLLEVIPAGEMLGAWALGEVFGTVVLLEQMDKWVKNHSQKEEKSDEPESDTVPIS